MPTAPSLSPEAQAQATASGGLAPANFLMAAAQLHGEGKLSAPVPAGRDPLASAKSHKPFGAKIHMVK